MDLCDVALQPRLIESLPPGGRQISTLGIEDSINANRTAATIHSFARRQAACMSKNSNFENETSTDLVSFHDVLVPTAFRPTTEIRYYTIEDPQVLNGGNDEKK